MKKWYDWHSFFYSDWNPNLVHDIYTCISKVQCRVNKSQKHNSVFSCTPSTSAHQGTLRDSQRYISQLSAAHLTLSRARNKCSGHGFPHLTHGDPAIPWFLLVRNLMHRTSRKLQMGGRAVLLHTSLRMACRFFIALLRGPNHGEKTLLCEMLYASSVPFNFNGC